MYMMAKLRRVVIIGQYNPCEALAGFGLRHKLGVIWA